MAKRSAQKSAEKNAARERAAALKAQQEAADRRKRLILVGATLGVIALIVIGLLVAALNRDDTSTAKASGATLSAEATKALTSVPASEIDAIGLGSADPSNLPKKVKNGSLIAKDGKPQILYVGAEYCPYCAGLRWSTALAMSRFGTWNSLQTTHSGGDPEPFPDTATLSFSQKSGTKLTSEHVDFVGYETATNEKRNGRFGKLDDLEGDDLKTFEKLNAAPYTTSPGAIPFISFGGKAVQAGGIFDTGLLTGKTAEDIALALKNPKDPISVAIIGGANAITAATCEATGGKPADVCTAPGVKAAAGKLTTVG